MRFIVYDDASGNILRTGQCPDDHIGLQARAGEVAIEDKWDGDTDERKHRIVNGKRIEFTPPPPALTAEAMRARAYRPIPDQLDALWHAMHAGTLPMVPEFYDPIAAVKAAYPKPKE
jgi:hypothetical protein